MTPQQRADIAVLDAVTDQAKARRMIKCARYKRLNARRGELIYQHVPKTNAELVELQRVIFRIIDLAYPLPPPLTELDALEQKLLRSIVSES